MRFCVRNKKSVSLKSFINELNVLIYFNETDLEKKIGIKFTEQEIKEAKEDIESEGYQRIKRCHDRLWKKNGKQRKKQIKQFKQLKKKGTLDTIIELIPKYTHKEFWQKKCKIRPVIGLSYEMRFGNLHYSILSDKSDEDQIQTIIHELIHMNQSVYSFSKDGYPLSDHIEITTIVITDLISKEMGIDKRTNFYLVLKKYEESYEDFIVMYNKSKDVNEFGQKVKEYITQMNSE